MQGNGATDGEPRIARERMVARQLASRDIVDERVLEAMRRVPRHLFVDEDQQPWAHEDGPLSIGGGQTISQPYIVAFMTQALRLAGQERVLEVGTGCGYQTALLAELAREVYTVEIVPRLATRAREVLTTLGYAEVHFRVGDGSRGWAEAQPFDAILVGAAAPRVPRALVEQLAPGGRLILPVGRDEQDLVLVERGRRGVEQRSVLPVRFVRMTGADVEL